MDSKYVTLFREIAHATEVLAERVMDYDRDNDNEKGVNTAQFMRDDFADIYNRIRAEDFNPDTLTKQDYQKLLVGTYIVVNNLQDKVKNEQVAISNYKTNIIPRLQRVIDECETQEEVIKLTNEIFVVDN